MKAFSTLAVEEDGRVAKDIVNEIVHGRFGEFASLAAGARETAWTFDFLF